MSSFTQRSWSVGVITLISMATASAANVTPSLQGLGATRPYAVSGDGSTVAGAAVQPFRWSQDEGLMRFGDYNGTTWALSADGKTVGGNYGGYAFRWAAEGGFEILERLPGYRFDHVAHGVSGDGAILVGSARLDTSGAYYQAVRWTRSEGIVGLGYLPGAARESSAAKAISADGRVVVGNAINNTNLTEAYRWTTEEGMVGLGLRPGASTSFVRSISADGSVILGWDALGDWLWTQEAGMRSLETDDPLFTPIAISGNGSVVVGKATASPEGHTAAIWDAVHGLRYVHEVLQGDLGVDITGFVLGPAADVSDDGLTIVGHPAPGFAGDGWIARLPEPSSILLLSLAGAALFGRGSRKSSREA